MVVDYLSSQLDWAGYQVSTTWGSGPSALGMVSPVDFENQIGLTTSRKEIAA